MPSPFEVIKAKVKDAIGDVLRESGGERRGRVSVVRTTRTSNAKDGKGLVALGRAYRLLDELKILVGDLDRVAGEVKGFLPSKKRASSGKKKRKGSKRRASAAKSSKGSTKRARGKGRSRRSSRASRKSGSLRTERTTIISESPRRHPAIA